MTVLLTGYEPFGDTDRNPSAELARDLDGTTVAGHDVESRILPVVFDEVPETVVDAIDEVDPDVVLGTGESAARGAVCFERLGINLDDAGGTPDNADEQPRGERIDADGPAAYFSTVPVEAAARRALDRGVPARVSNRAGAHLCNHFLYSVRHHAERRDLDVPVGFVHLPLTPEIAVERTDGPNDGVASSLPPELQRAGVEAALEATLD